VWTECLIIRDELRLERVIIIFKHLVPTSKKTQHFITEISWLMLFKEIITVYSEDHTKPTDTLCGQNAEFLIVREGSTYDNPYTHENCVPFSIPK
jgi:hypothetical protein